MQQTLDKIDEVVKLWEWVNDEMAPDEEANDEEEVDELEFDTNDYIYLVKQVEGLRAEIRELKAEGSVGLRVTRGAEETKDGSGWIAQEVCISFSENSIVLALINSISIAPETCSSSYTRAQFFRSRTIHMSSDVI